MKNTLLIALTLCSFFSCTEKKSYTKPDFVIANGQMPGIAKDQQKKIHLVYGSGDSIMYSYLSANDTSFSAPALVAVLPDLAASHTRGPQIACSDNGLTVTACNAEGDIFSYNNVSANWVATARVNDADTVAKENLMSLGGDGKYNYSVWLDLRGNRQNKIYGARSDDGGKTWSANKLIYASPDSTVCQCCKPSVLVKGNNVYVMFRNWLNGNRNMYLIQSADGGKIFGNAEKLGTGNWKLNGCPMDGGAMAIGDNATIQTVWRREGKVYAAQPGLPEKEIGEGKGCTVEIVNGNSMYAWVADGLVTVTASDGKMHRLGKGSQPILKDLNEGQMICIWEYEKQIHAAIFEL
ncbi:MAG: exo-alpha-sialidase [Ferruginibacter sp.]|nr:exo-alpha-sialidase [Ferruginibacter sp.]